MSTFACGNESSGLKSPNLRHWQMSGLGMQELTHILVLV